jgi:hypothetical protein
MGGMKPGSWEEGGSDRTAAGEPLLPSAPGWHSRAPSSFRSIRLCKGGRRNTRRCGRDRDSRRAVCVTPRLAGWAVPSPRGSGRPTEVARVRTRIPLTDTRYRQITPRPATTTSPARGRSRRERHAPCASARSPCGPRAAPRCQGLTGRLCYPCRAELWMTLPPIGPLGGTAKPRHADAPRLHGASRWPAGPAEAVHRAGDHPALS